MATFSSNPVSDREAQLTVADNLNQRGEKLTSAALVKDGKGQPATSSLLLPIWGLSAQVSTWGSLSHMQCVRVSI